MVAGDRVVGRFIYRGTHLGPLYGIPATGNPIEMRSIDIWRTENGEFVEHWDELNMLEVFQAVGVIPPSNSEAVGLPSDHPRPGVHRDFRAGRRGRLRDRRIFGNRHPSSVALVDDRTLVSAMGRVHEFADRRIRVPGIAGLLTAVAATVVFGFAGYVGGTIAGAVAVLAETIWLVIYTGISAPINARADGGRRTRRDTI